MILCNYKCICGFLKNVCHIRSPKMSILKVRGTHVKPTFSETLYL